MFGYRERVDLECSSEFCMPKLRLGVLQRSAGHLKHGGVRPPERAPTEPGSPDAVAGDISSIGARQKRCQEIQAVMAS